MAELLRFADPGAQTAAHRAAIDAATDMVLRRGTYIQGPLHDEFERRFAEYIGARHAVGVANGTDAIRLALTACDIGPGDDVLVPSHTATATVSAVRQAGAEPVFVDVDERSYVIGVESLAGAVGPKTRAIVGVHLYGCPLEAESVRRFCDEHNLVFVEDCAQAVGGRRRGRHVGTYGHIATFSFYPTKNLGAVGDAGAVTTDSSELAGRLTRLRCYGWSADRVSQEDGINSRLDELQAAILLAKLPDLDAHNQRRREIAERYRRGLAGLPLQLPTAPEGSEHVYHLFVVALDDRDALQAHLLKDGIMTAIHYEVPNHLHPSFRHCRSTCLSVTEAIVGRILSLPMYPELSDASVNRVCSSIRSFFAREA